MKRGEKGGNGGEWCIIVGDREGEEGRDWRR